MPVQPNEPIQSTRTEVVYSLLFAKELKCKRRIIAGQKQRYNAEICGYPHFLKDRSVGGICPISLRSEILILTAYWHSGIRHLGKAINWLVLNRTWGKFPENFDGGLLRW